MIKKLGLTWGVLILTAFASQATTSSSLWRYATDPHGSKAILTEPLVTEDRVAIAFERVPRIDAQNNSWVELIYDLPSANLADVEQITISYQSSKPMLIKLSQKEYGGEGDKSYAHYQVTLPPAQTWQSQTLTFNDFTRPDWTPEWSTDKGLLKEQISALYFVPALTDENGGQAWLKIKQVSLD